MRIKTSNFVASQMKRTRDDFKVETKRGSGKGGQNRNKRDTAVRITDLITGISAEICDERSQDQNKKRAFQVLVQKMIDHYSKLETRENPILKKEVRVYKEKEDLVICNRTGKRLSYKKVINGELPF